MKSVDTERALALVECWVTVERDGRTEWPIKRGHAEVLWASELPQELRLRALFVTPA